MVSDRPLPQRHVLLLLTFVMAASAALAGGLAVHLVMRSASSAPTFGEPAVARMPMASLRAIVPSPSPERSPGAALDAALGLPTRPASLDAIPALPLANAAMPLSPAPIPTELAPAAAAAPPIVAPPLVAGYALDLGYFLVPDQAAAFATLVQERGVAVQLHALPDPSGRVWTHVRTPPFAGTAQALAGAARIERQLGLPVSLIAPVATGPSSGSPAGASRP